ncbi:alkylphosphonate utilization protein [Tropicibacter oceani]|uniref:Alkylphosphonate utilization protein n=1 Tax=Tropicibacter oceani TaxID=3058420 RepID=A0ABY8QIM4_9RHOB|nr:alkylphosphonate utilization protein [Tropicibacter oceani]WGW04470.1 alkylphosphonate utilization protein [Tropicibacter oceani]
MTCCALCKADDATDVAVTPRDETVALCAVCADGLANGPTDGPHWQCLNDAIWSTVPAEQVVAWRLLKRLDALWANDLLDIAYLEPEVLDWAISGLPSGNDLVHRDVNGTVLSNGDTVTLIKALPVKGAGFTAKQGTAVRKISLEPDNAEHISGRVEGQKIVILTKFVKKS